jgi:transcription elongation factor Elf1
MHHWSFIMAAPRPGDYITTKCGRCNDITGHVIMLVLDGAIAKVECKACGSVHKYREAKLPKPKKADNASVRKVRAGDSRDKAVELGPQGGRARPAAAPRPTTPRLSTAAKIESAWQEAMFRHNGETPQPYAMQAAFSLHALLDHPVFGKGEVIKVVPPDKMDVLFQEGVKTLRCKL